MRARGTILNAYNRQATKLAGQYAMVKTEDIFPDLPDHLPRLHALDVGCGSGRDAAWLARQGYIVHAVDGSEGMLKEAGKRHRHPRLTFAHDLLPELANTRAKGGQYDLILLGAVWMHVHPSRRAEALNNLMELARPGALILISLRCGPSPADRPMFEVSGQELRQLAAPRLMYFEHVRDAENGRDQLARSNVWWENVYLRLPATYACGLQIIRRDILGSRMRSPHKPVLLLALERALSNTQPDFPDANSMAVPQQTLVQHWQAICGNSPSRVRTILLQAPLKYLRDPESGQPLFSIRREQKGTSKLILPRPVGQAIQAHGPLVAAGAVARAEEYLRQNKQSGLFLQGLT